MNELSARSHVPPATVKWYLRVGLLHKGVPTARNQANYDESHLHRLRLVRAMLEVGGLSVDRVRLVLGAIDDESLAIRRVVAIAHATLSSRESYTNHESALPAVDRYLSNRGWLVAVDSPARADLAAVLAALEALSRTGVGSSPPVADDEQIAQLLDLYADAMHTIAEAEIRALPPASDRERLVENVVVGTVLMEQAIGALRRLAQENAFNNVAR
jgi:DNA-binding transcriptional MerR regulator